MVIIITPRLIVSITIVPAARPPAEKVDPATIIKEDMTVVTANVIVLVGGKAPCVGIGLVLQVAL